MVFQDSGYILLRVNPLPLKLLESPYFGVLGQSNHSLSIRCIGWLMNGVGHHPILEELLTHSLGRLQGFTLLILPKEP